jgi:hypothetical protein
MGEQTTFNVFDQFAGCFVPYGLLALKKTSAGAKICYSLLAQQANARGVTQLNITLVATTLGEPESSIIRYLQELEQLRLIESSRGNANAEDVRISFPRHPWLRGQALLSPVPVPVSDQSENQAHLFAVEAAPSQASSVEETATNVGAAINGSSTPKSRRRRRRYGRPRSRHTYEDCLAFVTYQKEVQGRWWLYDLDRLAEFLYFTGQQDDDVSAYLSEVKNAA